MHRWHSPTRNNKKRKFKSNILFSFQKKIPSIAFKNFEDKFFIALFDHLLLVRTISSKVGRSSDLSRQIFRKPTLITRTCKTEFLKEYFDNRSDTTLVTIKTKYNNKKKNRAIFLSSFIVIHPIIFFPLFFPLVSNNGE